MFTEANTGKQMVLDACVSLGCRFVPALTLTRQAVDILVEYLSRHTLIKHIWKITAHCDRADEVIYKLQAILLTAQRDGCYRSNAVFIELRRSLRATESTWVDRTAIDGVCQ